MNGDTYESPPVGSGDYSDTSWYDWQTPLYEVYDPFIDWPSPLQQPDYPTSRYSGQGGESYQPDYQVTDYRFPDTPSRTSPPPLDYGPGPAYYDWQAPLYLTDTGSAPQLQSPSVSQQTLPVSPVTGLPYVPDYMLDPSLQPAEEPLPVSPVSGLPYIPDYMLDPSLQPPPEKKPGLLENFGDFLGNIGDFLWDTGEYVLKNIDLSGKSQSLPKGVTSPIYQAQYPVAADRTTSKEYVRIESQGYVTGSGAPGLGAGLAELVSGVDPKVLLIGGGALLLLLLSRK